MASYFRKEKKICYLSVSSVIDENLSVLEQLTEKLNSGEQHVQIRN